ncbi:molybdopterin-dependent oxidoreductase [Shewanella olleyana]|uniref:xanthine dehydrogenase family protein molybdopterin-binding subunit n=1 Tax=Shewanella olleyana TaxID=135626 RepID=UPI00200D0957|nr:molybdopterin cofactor-binding domain-containing protein [Shewanella olleyana]MCL1065802.1 molybdopterin-dependent oxidoreductase [Shewanella olleyana]
MKQWELSRRDFMKKCVIGGVTVYSAPMLLQQHSAVAAGVAPSLAKTWFQDGKPAFRFDAIEKITGEKIYGRDYRAKDIPSWPDTQHHAFIVRAHIADKVYLGLDLDVIPKELMPYKIITAADLQKNDLKLPPFYGDNMLLEKGNVPDYLGHEIAILLFDDFDRFLKAKLMLQFHEHFVKYAPETMALTSASKSPYAGWRIIREESANGSQGEDIYSTYHSGQFFPQYEGQKLIWPKPVKGSSDIGEQGMYLAETLRQDIASNEDWFTLKKEYKTQSIEPMMLEPEAYNGFYDKKSQTLHVVITTQSPQDFYLQAGKVLSESPLTKSIQNLVVHSPYIGGGFGGKDHTIFPYYGMIASIFANAPVRLANNRFEQFQSGLKRHPFHFQNQLAFDKTSLKLQGLVADISLDGGGRENFSSSVTAVGASAIQGIYYIPRNDIVATCLPSHLPTAGSMRGYGSLQSMASLEMMFNEAADEMKVDPFKLRRINAMVNGDKNTQGSLPLENIRYQEMLDLAEKHEIWQNRKTNKAKFDQANPDKSMGTGFGFVTKDYGTGSNAPSSYVGVTPDGKVVVKVFSVEMGTGTDTSQATLVAEYLGQAADNLDIAQIEVFDALEIFDDQSPYLMSQEHQDKMAKNPRWTPMVISASSASQSAFFQSHSTKFAAKILFEESLFLAAKAIWEKQGASGISIEDVSWQDGHLHAEGVEALSLSIICKKAHAQGMITGVMTHGFNRWEWATAKFEINQQSKEYPLDAIAFEYGIGANGTLKTSQNKQGFVVQERQTVNYPEVKLNSAMVRYYTPCLTMVDLAVHKGSGEVEILRTHTWIEPGKVHVLELVEGQIEGGLTMGIGHVLHEALPTDNSGAGNGEWNIDRYKVPFAKDNGVWNLDYTLMPAIEGSDVSKGLAEVVMIPIVPAVVEAIYQATQKRFYHLPITAKDILEANA